MLRAGPGKARGGKFGQRGRRCRGARPVRGLLAGAVFGVPSNPLIAHAIPLNSLKPHNIT